MQKAKYKIVPLLQNQAFAPIAERHAEDKDIAAFLRGAITDIIREVPALDGEEILDLLNDFRDAVQNNREFERLITVHDGVVSATYALHHPIHDCFGGTGGIRKGFQLRYNPVTKKSVFRPIVQEERQKHIRYRLQFLEMPVAIDCSTQEGKNTVLSKILRYAALECPAQCALAVEIVNEVANVMNKEHSCCKLIYTKGEQIAMADIQTQDREMIVPNVLKKDWWVMDREGVRLLEYSSEDSTATVRRVIVEGPLLSVRGVNHVCFRSQRKYTKK